MISAIGIMIAAYILTRMSRLIGQPRGEIDVTTKIFAGITVLVTLVCGLVILAIGLTPGPPLALR